MKKPKPHPPKLSGWLLSRFLSPFDRFTALGDLEEEFFFLVEEIGRPKARMWYRKQVLKSIPNFFINLTHWSYSMFKNYFKVALRNIKRQKTYSFINISGLAVGMACCILILLFVQDELSYDTYHRDADRIFRIVTDGTSGGNTNYIAVAPYPSGPVFTEAIPEISTFTRLVRLQGQVLVTHDNKRLREPGVFIADSTFFDIFTHQFLHGDSETSLKDPGTIVITAEASRRLFGEENTLGKVLTVENLGDLTVTGIIKNVPKNSHFTFNYIVSLPTLQGPSRQGLNRWFPAGGFVYVKLKEGADPKVIEGKFVELVETHAGARARQFGVQMTLRLQKITDIHLTSNRWGEIEANSDMSYVYIFSVIALFVLFIACINFMNLSTAKSSKRAREVGMRKVFGAYRRQLVKQFLGESTLMAVIGLTLSLIIVVITLPYFNSLAGKVLTLDFVNNITIFAGLAALIIFSGLVAGSYPAMFLSAFRPISILRGKLSKGTKGSGFRKSLVVFQFAISITLIAGTLAVFNQLDYMKGKRLGFDKDQILVIPTVNARTLQAYETVKNELLKNANILSVSLTSSVPGRQPATMPYLPEGNNPQDTYPVDVIFSDLDFVGTYGITMSAGRAFSREFESETEEAFLINETASKLFGWEYDEAIGKKLTQVGGTRGEGEIVGVMKDFHTKSLKAAIEPTAIRLFPRFGRNFSVRVNMDNISGTLDYLKSKWNEIEPNGEFNYFFLDEDFDKQYRAEDTLSEIFSYFAFIAIFIACLGLFGLASFTAEQRTKEIGIRKVLGASSNSIVLQLSQDFTKWVIIANIIAWPTAYYLVNNWMNSFAYRAGFGLGTLAIAGIASVSVAILTVGYQSIKSAYANPVDSLRYE